MTIEKISKSTWRISKTFRRKRYRVIVDHKPTQFEAETLIDKEIASDALRGSRANFNTAVDNFILSKKNVLSPSTEKLYRGYQRNIPKWFADLPCKEITSLDVQKLVSDYTPGRSPKTVANLSAFVLSVLSSVDVNLRKPKLPQKVNTEKHIPSKEEVQMVFQCLEDRYYVPLTLCCLGLRRSEVCALSLFDLHGNTLTINKALVRGVDGWEVKTTKTTESTRTIVIPEDIAQRIREQRYIFEGFPGTLREALIRAEDKAGVEHFTLHALRHFFASYSHQLGFTDKQIQAAGGWKTDHVMKTVYTHAMELDEAKLKMAENIASLLG